MSRIAGVIKNSDASGGRRTVDRMLEAMQPRLDWNARVEVLDDIALGWCGWRQPRLVADGYLLVSMDGAIYNRDELASNRLETDVEIVARLYLEVGFPAAIRKFNGDFTIGLVDGRLRKCFLARDRFGVKPAYYICDQHRFAFASRISALLQIPGFTGQVDNSFIARFAASHYRTFDNDLNASPYRDIKQLPAAHILTWADSGSSLSRYWTLTAETDFTNAESELAEQYRHLLIDSVELRYRRAARPAFTLSGGMDSSSVLACAVYASGHKQIALSTVYADKTYDESSEIKTMLDSCVSEWHPVRVDRPDIVADVTEMIEEHDEPVATATWLSHYYLCREIRRRGFGTVFGGLGGDELNAGEYEYFFYFFSDLHAAGLNETLNRETQKWIEYHDHPVFKKTFDVVNDGLSRLVDLKVPGQCLTDRRRLQRYAGALNPDYFDLESFEPLMDRVFPSYLKNRTYQDIFRETAPCCLRALDRQATAAGFENTLPFFDHRLVEFMFRVPGNLKIRRGVTKHLLREAMRGLLPEETRTRIKKTGWNAPAHLWFSGNGRELLLDIVTSSDFRGRGIYKADEVLRLIEEHDEIVRSGRPQDNHMMFLWQLLNLELWFQWLKRRQSRVTQNLTA